MSPACLFGQNKPEEAVVTIGRSIDKINLDGHLDEQTWKHADVARDFYLTFPVDNDFPKSKTEVRMAFDDKNMYFGIVCYDPSPGGYLVESLRRDWDWRPTENVSIYIDPFDDRTNGFNFSISPYNSQREGLISDAQEISADWDNKWYSEVSNEPDRWTVEIAIPFKTLRYKEEITNWNIQFIRNDVKNNQRSAWTAVPQQYRTNNLAFAGRLKWLEPPPSAGNNVSVIPYVLGKSTKNFEEGTANEISGNIGLDAKIAVTSSLNLDLTVNPDFSQVEVDQQVANLDRFEIFFPEKRQFFLENSDLFARSGFPSSRPFFSRRIGIATDTSGNNVQIPIIFGARLSGKLNKDWRIGVLNMQTGSHDNTELTGAENPTNGTKLAGQNYTVAIVQRKLWTRSNISALMVNRQAIGYDQADTLNSGTAYNRVGGVDFNYSSDNNKWRSNIYVHASFDPEKKKNAISHGAFLGYESRHWALRYFHTYTGEGYNAELGFVRRTGVFSIGTFDSKYIIYPKNGKIVTIEPGIRYSNTFKTDVGGLADRTLEFNMGISFLNSSQLNVALRSPFTRLFNNFDPTRSDGVELPVGSSYSWVEGEAGFSSDTRKPFNLETQAQFGSYYNGNKLTLAANAGYKFRPYGSIFVSAIYNNVRLPQPYNSTAFWLVGPKLDVTFSNSLFLATFVQYNEQADNLNINARFQWRFAPVSDLFIVYTDNYFPTDLVAKNRSVVIKLSY